MTKFNLKSASVPVLRARFSLPSTSLQEKRRIADELLLRQQKVRRAVRQGKKPAASISRIYDKERTRSLGKKPLQGGRGG